MENPDTLRIWNTGKVCIGIRYPKKPETDFTCQDPSQGMVDLQLALLPKAPPVVQGFDWDGVLIVVAALISIGSVLLWHWSR